MHEYLTLGDAILVPNLAKRLPSTSHSKSAIRAIRIDDVLSFFLRVKQLVNYDDDDDDDDDDDAPSKNGVKASVVRMGARYVVCCMLYVVCCKLRRRETENFVELSGVTWPGVATVLKIATLSAHSSFTAAMSEWIGSIFSTPYIQAR